MQDSCRFSAGVGSRAPADAREGEGHDPRPRRAGRRAPADAVDGRGEGVRVRRAQRQGEPARPVRRPPSADRLPRLLRARRVRLARPCLPRLLDGGRPGRPSRPSQRPRHHARVRLARAAGGHRAPEGADGMGDDPLVHHHRQLRRRLRRRRVARHQRVHPRRRQDFPHLLHQQPRRRADGGHLELPRHHAARPPGGVGGFARGLSADPDLQVVELARQLRRRRRARQEMGRGVGRRRGRVPERSRRARSHERGLLQRIRSGAIRWSAAARRRPTGSISRPRRPSRSWRC